MAEVFTSSQPKRVRRARREKQSLLASRAGLGRRERLRHRASTSKRAREFGITKPTLADPFAQRVADCERPTGK